MFTGNRFATGEVNRMRSGNGRHRRPRQAPAIVVAAGVTGAGIAMPLFGAAGAQAADADTWDRVAECESGGMWSANEGDGFYGGLRLTLDLWKKYGGTEYAPRPDLASRSQQISVAESILGDRGPGAWPNCSLGTGLTGSADAPDVNPGRTATPETDPEADPAPGAGRSDGSGGSDASGPAERPDTSDASRSSDGLDGSASDGSASGGSEESSKEPAGESSKKPADEPADEPSGEPADEDSKGSAGDSSADPAPTGRHRGAQDAGERAGDGGSGDARPSGRHASRDGVDRTQDPTGDAYTVRPGDNLSGIAEDQNVSRGWQGLYEDNEDLIGIDPDLILPGQRLDLTVREQ